MNYKIKKVKNPPTYRYRTQDEKYFFDKERAEEHQKCLNELKEYSDGFFPEKTFDEVLEFLECAHNCGLLEYLNV